MVLFGVALTASGALLAASCSHPSYSPSHIADPPGSVPAKPDYTQSCSPSGADASVECTQVILQSIDNARAKEHVGPMVLPSDFGRLSVPQQLFVALKKLRRDVRFVRFPGENHEMSRSGKPRHRLERFRHILEWFAGYLGKTT